VVGCVVCVVVVVGLLGVWIWWGSSARDVEDGRKHEFVTFVARRTGHVLF
jgi:hypothetical protein